MNSGQAHGWEVSLNNPRIGITVFLSSVVIIVVLFFIVISSTTTNAKKEVAPQQPTFADIK